MKTRSLLLFLVAVPLLFGCKKEGATSVPVLSTVPVTMFTERTAMSGGVITSDGGGALTEMGVCWSRTADPTTLDTTSLSVTSSNSFTCNMTHLAFATVYHVRAFATNSVGTGYGDDVSFTTEGAEPSITTDDASNIVSDGATLSGSVNPNYLSSIVTFYYGTTTTYSDTVSYTKNPVIGNIPVAVSTDLTGLTPSTTYHFKITAVNPMGAVEGEDMTFTTPAP